MSPVYWELIIYIIHLRHFIKQMFKASFCILLCVILESLSYSFISISLLTNGGRRGRDRQCLSLLSCEFGS
jgi:hypothetical protein